MKFRMFTDAIRDVKIAINVDEVAMIRVADPNVGTTEIWMVHRGTGEFTLIEVAEDFDTVFSRLNTIAE